MPRPLHVVQIGYDDTVFHPAAPSDTRQRQALYARLLDARRPGSRLTLLSLTGDRGCRPAEEGLAAFLPVAGPRWLRPARLLAALFRLHRRRPIDVCASQTLFTDGWVALLFGARAGVPVVGQVHFDLFGPDGGTGPGAPPWRAWVAGRLLRRFAALRVVSRQQAAVLAARGAHPAVAVVPVPATLPAPPGDRPGAGGPPRVLYVGRLAPQKNLARWLRVARRVVDEVPEVELVWAGDGPLRADLRAQAAALGLAGRLDCRGAVPYAALPALYGSAAVLLLTSDYEGVPRVAAEAGLCGLPVVAPALPGMADVVRSGETGVLCPPGDEAALADAVIMLVRDPGRRARMGARAHQLVAQELDPERLAGRWVDLLVATAAGTRR